MSEQQDQKDPPTVKLRTRSNVRKLRVEWVLENFALLSKPNGEKIESSTFCLPGDTSRPWSLWVYPNSTRKEASEYVSVYLHKHFKGRVSTEFELCLLDSEDQKIKSLITTKVFDSDNDWGYPQYVKRDELFIERERYLAHGNLKILLELKVLDNEEHCSFIQCCVKNETDWRQLELSSMLENSETSDVWLTVGGKEFALHKAVLAARSPVFAAMFKHGLEEASTGEVKISDISAEVMGEVVRYIYTGVAPDRMGEMAEELLAAADKYDLEGLKEKCSRELLGRLAVDTASQLLVLADTHQVAKMKADVMEFILGHASQVLAHPSWKEVAASCSHLVADVNASIVDNLLFKLV